MGRGIRYAHVETILRNYYAKRGGKVLEIGAGGAVYKDIFDDYIGTDLPKNPYSEKGDLDVYCDAQYLPFKENSFGMAFAVATLYQIQNTDLVLSEINRVLRADAHFIVFDYNKKTTKRLKATEGAKSNQVWSPRELKRTIQKAGFHAQIINPWRYAQSGNRIKAMIMKVPGLWFIAALFFEGWNIILATKTKRNDKSLL